MDIKIEIKKLPGSVVEIDGEIPALDFEAERKYTVSELGKSIKIDGFRPGNIPEKVLIEKIGEPVFLEHMAERALSKAYPEIIKNNKIEAIGRPEITITKIAKDNPLGFKIKTIVLPEIELAGWRPIAEKVMSVKEEIKVGDKEVDDVIENIRKSRAKVTKTEDAGSHSSIGEGEEGKERPSEPVLPEFTDDFVKTLGDFKNVADFREKIAQNIKIDKEMKNKEKKRIETIEKIIEKSKLEVPDILIESEKGKMLAEMKASVDQMGLKWEDYLGHLKKTEEEVLNGWNEDARKRSSFGLILREIAIKENVNVSDEELEAEVDKIVAHYQAHGQEIERERVRDYAFGVLRNEKVFEMLEKAGEK
ncbi:MAG: hypothetical protein NUV64_00845 [Parcubacteria group bacterium]|nr:hypothetical protein [Parcubacteria group bacterium]MCR4342660.1 hypothetical protein [Patescibacteria group bacterium]